MVAMNPRQRIMSKHVELRMRVRFPNSCWQVSNAALGEYPSHYDSHWFLFNGGESQKERRRGTWWR